MYLRSATTFLLISCGLATQSRPSSALVELAPGSVCEGVLDDSAERFTLGTWVRARQSDLSTAGNAFRFRASATGSYTITCTSLEFDTAFLVFDESKRTQRFVDEGGVGVDARITLQAEAGAEYRIVVCDPDGEGGHFSLSLVAGAQPPLAGDEAQRQRLEQLRSALAHCRAHFAPSDPRISSRAYDLARVLPASGSFDEPDRLYREAVTARTEHYGAEHVVVALTRANWGSLMIQRGQLGQARDLIESALAIYQRDDRLGPVLSMGTIANLAALDRIEGHYEQALERYRQVLADAVARRSGSDELYLAKCRNNCAGALLDCGRWDEARSEFDAVAKARERLLGPRNLETIAAWNNLADACMRLGEYEEARKLFERAVAAAERSKLQEHPLLARVQSNLATLCSRQGRPADAVPLLERAIAILEKNFGKDHADRVQPLCALANLALARGDVDRAEPLLLEALRLLKRTSEDHPQIGVVQTLLSRCQLKRGNQVQALDAVDAGIRVLESAYGDDGHTDLANALRAKSEILCARGDAVAATRCATTALALYRRWLGEDHPSTSLAYAQLARLARRRGEIKEALDLLQRSFGSRPGSLDRQLPALSETARIAWAASQREVLDEILTLTADPAAGLAPAVVQPHVASWKGLVARGLTRGRSAFQNRENLIDDAGHRTRQELDRVLTELARFDADNGARNAAQRRAALSLLCAKRSSLERTLASAVEPHTESRSQAKVSLPETEVLIDYFVYHALDEPRLVAFVLRGGHPPCRYELGPLAAIADAIEAHRRLLGRTLVAIEDRSAEALVAQVGRRVLGLVLEPFRHEWLGASKLWIVPDGPLVLLSFATLPGSTSVGSTQPTAMEQRYLIEDLELATLPSSTGSGPDQLASSRPTSQAALLVGGVTYGTGADGNPRFAPLPGTSIEVAELAELWERARPGARMTTLSGSAASERSVKLALVGASYVHFATHGFCRALAGTDPRLDLEPALLGVQSGVALALGDQSIAADEDGILTAEELSWCDLRSCELVTLSACDTGLGTIQNGESLAGLRRSLRIAGARATLTTLWPIEDQSARTLVHDVCDALWMRGAGPSHAVWLAQLKMLIANRAAHHGQALPGTWGAFVLEQVSR